MNFRGVQNISWFWGLIYASAACLSAQPSAPVLKTLHAFNGSNGESPYAAVTIGSGGVLYGTTTYGGLTTNCTDGCGVVYSLTPPAAQGDPWTAQLLHRFTGAADGGWPYGGIALGSNGVLYGTTNIGGAGYGTVYSMTPPATSGDAWTLNTIWTFDGTDGGRPWGGVVVGSGSVLYGATESNVFSLSPPASPGGAWSETVLHTFGQPGDGFSALSPLAMGSDGVLYGTTSSGGAYITGGTVYAVRPPAVAGGPWTEAVLHSFSGGSDGSFPWAGVAVTGRGTLYGTTSQGGGSSNCESGCGTIYSLIPPSTSGGTWTEKILYSFTDGADGAQPIGGVVIDSGGVLYSTAEFGGNPSCNAGCGTVISLTPPASAGEDWTTALVYAFTGGDDGANPQGTLALSTKGVLYGTASLGGPGGDGTVFLLKP